MQHWRAFRPLFAIVLALMLMAPVGSTVASVAAANAPEPVIVGLRPSAGNPGTVSQTYARQFGFQLGFVYRYAMHGFSAMLPPTVIQALSRNPNVAYVEPDYKVQAYGDIVPTGISRVEAPQNPNTGIDPSTGAVTSENPAVKSVNIAILDTGIGPNSDLNVVGGVNCGTTWWGASSCTAGGYADNNDHGTHVSGTAAGMGVNGSVVGVAPGARLWAVKVLDSQGNGSISTIIAGLDWIIQQGNIDVVNMSFGCNCSSSALDSALYQAANSGIVLVAAAGNSAQNVANFSPANNPDVIAVSAVADYNGQPGGGASPSCYNFGADDSMATFSNFGQGVTIAAPGVCITSTLPNNQLGTMSGTSMATPHVTGAAALDIAINHVARGPNRWLTVKNDLLNEWSVPQNSPCGFTNGDGYEPMLLLAPCDLGGTITGKVTIAGTSTGITGATITAAPTSGPALTTTTGSNGSYTFNGVAAGSYTVTASDTGYANGGPTSLSVATGQTYTANFSLTPTTGTISGQVTISGTTTGIQNATITATPTSGTPLTTSTDASGNYSIANVPPGSYTVTAAAPGYNTGTDSAVGVTAGNTATANFSLTVQVGTISGTVTDTGGTPLVGATVSAGGQSTPTTTGGAYTLANVPTGSQTVTASLTGYVTGSQTISVTHAGPNTANFQLAPQPGTISGTVTIAGTNTGISNATITATPSGGGTALTTTTGGNGSYSLGNVPPGSYTVTASAPGYAAVSSQPVSVSVGPGGSASATFTLRLEAGTITGLVTDTSGTPLVGATVTAGGQTIQTTTGGAYTLTNVPAGNNVVVTASLSGYTSAQTQVTVPDQGNVTASTLQLAPAAGTLTGTVTLRGRILSGATVTLSGNGVNLSTTTDGSGHYQFTNVPAGTYSVTASAYWGWIRQTQSVTIGGGTTTLNFNM